MLKKLGASEVLISTNPLEIEKWANQFDLLINTIPVGHDINPYLGLLKKRCDDGDCGSDRAS